MVMTVMMGTARMSLEGFLELEDDCLLSNTGTKHRVGSWSPLLYRAPSPIAEVAEITHAMSGVLGVAVSNGASATARITHEIGSTGWLWEDTE